ncbi:MAG: hypothetical protein M3386_05430 [Actinomycetota bacterium]|nr:hypothetical protein [Actinomycetota bacterium]
MARTKTPTPLYAVLGAGDLVAERIRRTTVETDPRHAAQQQLGALRAELRALPDRAQSAAHEALGQAASVYGDLAERGETLVTRVRNQQSTKDAAAAAKTTKSQAKATVTTARKESAQAAKATTTTAKKQAGKTADQGDKTAEQAAEGAKATKTTAKRTTTKATNATRPRAKATRTSARKTAEATTKAATDAAAKVGD